MHHIVPHQSLPSHPCQHMGWLGRNHQEVRNIKIRCKHLFVCLQSPKKVQRNILAFQIYRFFPPNLLLMYTRPVGWWTDS